MQVIKRSPGRGYLDSSLWLPKEQVNVEGTKQALTFQVFDKNSVRFLTLWRETDHHLIVPREFWDTTEPLNFQIVDCRPVSYERVDIRSRIRLDHLLEGGVLIPTGKTVQEEALQALLSSRGGVLQLACGLGKTIVALEYASRLKVPTLIVVDTTQLVTQWREEIEQFLDVPGGIGMIGDGEFDWKKSLVIATYHTLANRALRLPEEVRRWFGLVIWDEAHHVAAPIFARSADLFPGRRLGLTATPTRADGMHVVYHFHIGKVLYKNLHQDLKPKFYFKWTGFRLDPGSDIVKSATQDKNGELHLGKLASHLGRWKQRLQFILTEVRGAVADGRKVLVLSKSVDECVNLLAMWNGRTDLYTDIPYPSEKEVGEVVAPVEIDAKTDKAMRKHITMVNVQLKDNTLNSVKREALLTKKRNIEFRLAQGASWRKTESLYHKRQREYLKDLLLDQSTGGLMIYKVDVDTRTQLLRSKRVTFAIMKYGREGLNEKSLDTLIACEPMKDKGALQQLMGRVQRKKEGKKGPVVVFLEDDIGLMIGMCTQLRQHLREWPADEGGPFDYELIGHPSSTPRRKTWMRTSSNSP